MSRIVLVMLAALLASCSLFGLEDRGKVTATLQPERVNVDEQVSLTIKNRTYETIWYHCSYTVERLERAMWHRQTSVGCVGTTMPVPIKPRGSLTIETDLIAADRGTYRIRTHLTDHDRNVLDEAARTTNSVRMVD